jgi:hypothetical protein
VLVKVFNTQDSLIATSLTDVDGFYYFNTLEPGTYRLKAETQLQWKGGNATDALIINLATVGSYSLSDFRSGAADVNLSETINATDGLLIKKRTIAAIDTFPSGDWYFDGPEFVLNSNLYLPLRAICYGDVNASYQPSGAKSNSTVELTCSSVKDILPGERTEISISTIDLLEAGAMTLVIDYPEDKIRFVRVVNGWMGLLYEDDSEQLRLAWSSTESMQLSPADELLRLEFVVLPDAKGDISLSISNESEFADSQAKILSGIQLTYPSMQVNDAMHLMLEQNFPNPFSSSSLLSYTIPHEGLVTIKLVNTLGQEVTSVCNQQMKAGRYSHTLLRGNLSSGIYQCILSLETNQQLIHQSIMLMIEN